MKNNGIYNSGENYWYMRFKIDFFNRNVILQTERLGEVGQKFIIIYLKMCLQAVSDKGFLYILNHSLFDSTYEEIAHRIREDVGVTRRAIDYWIQKGMINVYDAPEVNEYGGTTRVLVMKEAVNNIGKSSRDADRKRLERNKALSNSDQITLALEEPGENKPKKAYGVKKNIYLTEEEYSELSSYKNFKKILLLYGAIKEDDDNNDYENILKLIKEDGGVIKENK